MDTNQGYKDKSLASLEGQWGKAVIATLIVILLAGCGGSVISLSFGSGLGFPANLTGQSSSLLWSLLCLPLSWAATVFFLRMARKEDVDYGRLFDGYRGVDEFLRILLTELLKGLYIFLWSLLLIIPGIIKSYSYAMTDFILKDNPDMKYDTAIERSMQMMYGQKERLFWLDLSFIGWGILSIMTFGIGFLFLIPYIETARAHFYEDLKAQA